RPRAVTRHVARAGRGAGDDARRLAGVGGTHGARAGAGLVHVAEAGGGPAHRPGVPRRVLAVVTAAVALVAAARVAVVGARRSRQVGSASWRGSACLGEVIRPVEIVSRG